jgi:hypothetical protein
LILDLGFDEKTATEKFFSSNTFEKLSDTVTKLSKKDWTKIYELLKQELNNE